MQFIEITIFACHEDASIFGTSDAHYVYIVCRDGEQRLWQQLHLTWNQLSKNYINIPNINLPLYHSLSLTLCNTCRKQKNIQHQK